ncbi:MAG: HDOD domain-containing protein [Candidatus Omnitrophota bacterium]
MGEVNIDDLKEGMVLAQDLKDTRGRFLLQRGTVIDKDNIRIMKIWGVVSVDIQGLNREEAGQDILASINPETLNKAESYVETMFRHSTEPHEALTELKRLCVLQATHHSPRETASAGFEKIEKAQKSKWPLIGADTPPSEIKPSLSDLASHNIQLSSFPDIYHQIMELLKDPRTSASHLSEVVSKDPGLSASILKLVNSSFYGLPNRVDSITRAISLIGGKELSTLAMGISAIRYFKGIPPELVDMKSFWIHSIACGVFARILANHKVDLSEEQLFTGGLLHDIGRLILYKALPQTSAYAIQQSGEKDIPLYRLEKDIFGYDHSDVAGVVLDSWNFSKSLVQMIRHHHSPLSAKSPLEPAIIMVSNIMARAFRFGYSGNPLIPPFEKQVWDVLELSPSVLSYSIKQADRQVSEILRAFNLSE